MLEEVEFKEAHEKHEFFNIAYWGIPYEISSKIDQRVGLDELRIMLDKFKILCSIDPILPYSIALLCLRIELIELFLHTLSIPYLALFAVLLFRIEFLSLLEQEIGLRNSVYSTFLSSSNQLSDVHICQASDVMFKMIALNEKGNKQCYCYKEFLQFCKQSSSNRILSLYQGS